MKIAIIHSIYRPYTRGGAEVVVENVVTGLKQKGEEVFVVTLGYENKVEEIDGVKIYRVEHANLFNFIDINSQPAWLRLPWHLIDMFNFSQVGRIERILADEKPDLVLTHNLKGLGYLTCKRIRKLNLKNTHTVHDAQLLHPTGLYDLKKKTSFSGLAAIYRIFCRRLFGSPEEVIFPSEYIKNIYDHFKFFPQSQKTVLGNPINLNSSVEIKSDSVCDKNKTLNILFLGQVEEYKGILTLIKAIKNISDNYILHVVGSGKALDLAKELAKDLPQIKFYGRVSSEEKEEKIWPQIDLLINPSETPESFGMVVLEAYAHGVPVIASNIGALSELVKEGQTGMLFEAGDAESLKNKIQFFVDNACGLGSWKLLCEQEAKKYSLDNYLNKILNKK